jgi:hypothetical protein
MNATAPQLHTESITAAVKAVAARCAAPALVTLTATGDTVTGRPEKPAGRSAER